MHVENEETMDIEELNIISKEVTKNLDETTCGILDTNEVSAEFEDQSEFPSFDNGDQKMQATKKIEKLDMARRPTEHPMDLIVGPHPEQPIKASEEHAINRDITKDNQVIKVPHIDYIFGDQDQPLILGDCVQTITIYKLKHLVVRSHIQADFRFQKQR